MTALSIRESDAHHDGDDRDAANEEIIREGEAAVDRVLKGQHFSDWIAIAKATDIGRSSAMHKSRANHPRGSTYNKAFGAWLDEHPKFKAINSATMSQLSEILKNLEAIENWRATLAANERLRLNHPDAVLKKWKARTQLPKDRRSNRMREAVARLEEEIIKLKSENANVRRENADLQSENADLRRRARHADDAAAAEQEHRHADNAAPAEEQRESAEGQPHTPERTVERVNKLFQQIANENRNVRMTAADKLHDEIKRGDVDLRDLMVLRLTDDERSKMAKAMSTRRRLLASPETIARDIDYLWPVDTVGQAQRIAACWFALVKERERDLS